jgi:SAM-dependent methyltransferase
VDIADDALAEAQRNYHRPNLSFQKADVEKLPENPHLGGSFDTIVNLENLEHLQHGDQFVAGARACLRPDGILVVSTPNGDLTERDEQGNIKNQFHIKEYTQQELTTLLAPRFERVEVFGQWRTPAGKARLMSETKQFQIICELYYNPFARLWRGLKGLMGKECAPEPTFDAAGLGLPWEFTIASLADAPFPWAPEVLIAVCHV